MLVIKTKLKEISGKGIGLIANQEIKKGDKIWVYNPVIDFKILKKNIPEEMTEFFHIYACDYGKDYIYFNSDNARFINHSETPNITSLGELGDDIALRDIHVGEEITINYKEIDVNTIDFDMKN